jgi:hypothetical protein
MTFGDPEVVQMGTRRISTAKAASRTLTSGLPVIRQNA